MTVGKPITLVVLISGTGSNLKSLLAYCPAKQVPAHFALVVSDQGDAPGLEHAKAAGVPTAVVPREKGMSRDAHMARLRETVAAANPDLVVLAGFMRILSPDFIRAFPDKIINIHPSLLPSFRGLHAQEQAHHAGVRIAGCTVHLVNEEVDAGIILAQAAVPALPTDTAEELRLRILSAEHKLLPEVVAALAHGQIRIRRLASEGSIPARTRVEYDSDRLALLDQKLFSIRVS